MNKGKLQHRGRYTIAFPLLGIAILWVSLAGCAAHYPINPSEGSVDRQLEYQVKKMEQARSDEVFMVLCFSGGGTRAASMAYGVLEALQASQLACPPDGAGAGPEPLKEDPPR